MTYNRLYVSNLSAQATASSLQHCFAPYGEVRNVELVAERHGSGAPSAFVTMATTQGAERAERELSGSRLDGRSLAIVGAGISVAYPPDRQRGRNPEPEQGTKVAITQQFRSRIGMVYELSCAAEQLTVRTFYPPADAPADWRVEASAKSSGSVGSASGATRKLAFDALVSTWTAEELDWPRIAEALRNVRAI